MSKRSRMFISRREFMQLSAVTAAGVVAVACGGAPAPAEAPAEAPAAAPAAQVPAGPPSKYNEAPMLAVRVQAGELPPVDERLPVDVEVVEVESEIGQYGGTLRTVTIRAEGYGDDTITMGCEGLVRTARDASSVAPNLAKSWEFSEDGTVLTLHLREGMKWSDGAPFTADDIMFWYEDVLLNPDITPAITAFWKPGGEVMKIEKVDDYTLTYTSPSPNPLILLFDSPLRGTQPSAYQPKHWMQKFHPKYTPQEEVDALAKADGYETWWQFYTWKSNTIWGTPLHLDQPSMCAYVMTSKDSEQRVYERNPYYWKVDTAGNQLPYIDNVTAKIAQNREIINNMIITGQLDVAIFEPSIENFPLYRENEAAGYRTLNWQSVLGSDVIYQVNQTIDDPALRPIFQDKRFRQALSLAMNRDEINEVLYFGLATPRQHTVIPGSKYFEEEFATAYAAYDPDEANRLLDEMGLEWDSNHEFRLRPDGERLAWLLEYFPVETPKTPITELVVDHWRAIGLDVTFKEISGELSTQRYPANLVQMGLWHGDYATDVLFPQLPSFYGVPCYVGWSRTWDVQWAHWYQDGTGEEPPEEIKAQWDRWQRMITTLDEQVQIEAGKEILASQAENLWTIGTVGLAPHPVIAGSTLSNFPDEANHGWDVIWSNYLHPEQFYMKQA